MASRKKKADAAPRQTKLEFPNGHGGRRKGAGPKRKAPRPRVPHRKRAKLSKHHPVLVTQRIKNGLPSLRTRAVRRVLELAIGAAQERFGMRVVHYSLQHNHFHLIVEAESEESLSSGMGALKIRMARALNKLWGRSGSVFEDRYHAEIKRTPRENRNGIAYVLCNAAHHHIELVGPDPCSSGQWFDGWTDAREADVSARELPPHLVRPRTWLLNVGWKKHGLISVLEVPGRAD